MRDRALEAHASHAAHAAHTAHTTTAHRSILLRQLHNHGLRGDEQGRDTRRIYQGSADHLGRVDDAGLDKVLVLACGTLISVSSENAMPPLHDEKTNKKRPYSAVPNHRRGTQTKLIIYPPYAIDEEENTKHEEC